MRFTTEKQQTTNNTKEIEQDSPRLKDFLDGLQNYLVKEWNEPEAKETGKLWKKLKKQFFHDLEITDKERFLFKNSLIGVNNKLLVKLMLSIWGKCVSWNILIKEYLSSLANVINEAKDHVISQRNQEFLKYLSKHREIKLYFYYYSVHSKKLSCELDDGTLTLDFDKEKKHRHQFQFIRGEWYWYKIQPFPCPFCDDFWFEPLTFQNCADTHICQTPEFFCDACRKSFWPLEPNQRNCGCKGKYKLLTAEGHQIRTLLKHQKFLLSFEDPGELKNYLIKELDSEFLKPPVINVLGSFSQQLKCSKASCKIINKIRKMNENEFMCFIQQKVTNLQMLILQLYEQTFLCCLCLSDPSDHKDNDRCSSSPNTTKQKTFFACQTCHQVTCPDHKSKGKGSRVCVTCHSSKKGSPSLQLALSEVIRKKLLVKKSIKKSIKK